MKGKMITVSRNSNQSDKCPFVPNNFVEKFTGLKSSFYTVDFAQLDNGKRIIICKFINLVLYVQKLSWKDVCCWVEEV